MKCRVCDSERLKMVIDLNNQPLGNIFLTADEVGKEPYYPLRLVYCEDCGLSQLDHTVKKEVIYTDHTYLSGVTRSLREHFQRTAERVDARFFADRSKKAILDVGSNDGTQLEVYRGLNYEVLGVESTKRIADIANQRGIPTIQAFFNESEAEKLGKKFEVVNASGVFFHLEELHSVTRGIKKVLASDGVFVVQFIYMKSIMENVAFDQIYHEHLLYYTLKTIEKLLHRHGLMMFDAYLSPVHGGSVIGYVGHQGARAVSKELEALRNEEEWSKCNELSRYAQFREEIEESKIRSLAYLRQKKAEGKRVMGMGAPVKGNTLLNYFGIGSQYLDALVEKNSLRKGLFSPGMHLPIWIEGELPYPPDVYYVLAWNFKEEILKNHQSQIAQGLEFYFPVEPKERVYA